MSTRDLLNQGVRITEYEVAAGSVPEADPSLATHGYATVVDLNGLKVHSPYILCLIDFTAGTAPTGTFDIWGYSSPPPSGNKLESDWIKFAPSVTIDSATSSPGLVIIPVVGFDRIAIPLKAIGGTVAPTDVNVRILGISEHVKELLSYTSTGSPSISGAVVVQTPTLFTDGDVVTLITDLYRRLRVVSPAYDSVTGSDQVTNLNTIATDYDDDDAWANETNIAAGNQYYPSSSGHYVGTQNSFGCILRLNQILTLDFEVSNDQTIWVNATKSLYDCEANSDGYDNTHYTEVAGANADFAVTWEKCEFSYVRFLAVRNNAANALKIDVTKRAN